MGCQLLLQGIFWTLESTLLFLRLLRCRLILHLLSHQGSQRAKATSFSLLLAPPCGQQGFEQLCLLSVFNHSTPETYKKVVFISRIRCRHYPSVVNLLEVF